MHRVQHPSHNRQSGYPPKSGQPSQSGYPPKTANHPAQRSFQSATKNPFLQPGGASHLRQGQHPRNRPPQIQAQTKVPDPPRGDDEKKQCKSFPYLKTHNLLLEARKGASDHADLKQLKTKRQGPHSDYNILLMNGGRAFVTDEHWETFLKKCAFDIANNLPTYYTEVELDPKKPRRLGTDMDYVCLNEYQSEAQIWEHLKVMQKTVNQFCSEGDNSALVMVAPPKRCLKHLSVGDAVKKTLGGKPLPSAKAPAVHSGATTKQVSVWKVGVHVVWFNTVLDYEKCLRVRASWLNDLTQAFGPPETVDASWASIVDESIYAGGLRMPGQHKCQRCSVCKAKNSNLCLACNASGRLKENRSYQPVWFMTTAGSLVPPSEWNRFFHEKTDLKSNDLNKSPQSLPKSQSPPRALLEDLSSSLPDLATLSTSDSRIHRDSKQHEKDLERPEKHKRLKRFKNEVERLEDSFVVEDSGEGLPSDSGDGLPSVFPDLLEDHKIRKEKKHPFIHSPWPFLLLGTLRTIKGVIRSDYKPPVGAPAHTGRSLLRTDADAPQKRKAAEVDREETGKEDREGMARIRVKVAFDLHSPEAVGLIHFIHTCLPEVYSNVVIRNVWTNKARNSWWVTTKSSYCQNVKREHNSNTIYFMASGRDGTVAQRCWCQCDTLEGRQEGYCKDYTSQSVKLPNDLIVLLFNGQIGPKKRNGGGAGTKPPAAINAFYMNTHSKQGQGLVPAVFGKGPKTLPLPARTISQASATHVSQNLFSDWGARLDKLKSKGTIIPKSLHQRR